MTGSLTRREVALLRRLERRYLDDFCPRSPGVVEDCKTLERRGLARNVRIDHRRSNRYRITDEGVAALAFSWRTP